MNPSEHLPLLGMEGFDGNPTQACQRMEGFFISAGEALKVAGHESPVELWLVPAMVADTSCALGDPGVEVLIERFQVAWAQAGLPAVGPLTD